VRAPVLLLLAASCASPRATEGGNARLDEAHRLARVPDWPRARRAAEEARLLAPEDPETARLLGRILLSAFGDVDGAERRFAEARDPLGLALCALARGAERQAEALLLEAPPSPEVLRERALLYLGQGREREAQEALDAVARDGGDSMEADLLLAAAGRAPPSAPPLEWWFGLGRARVSARRGEGAAARREILEYARLACASEAARRLLRRRLERDFALSQWASVLETG